MTRVESVNIRKNIMKEINLRVGQHNLSNICEIDDIDQNEFIDCGRLILLFLRPAHFEWWSFYTLSIIFHSGYLIIHFNFYAFSSEKIHFDEN